MQHACIKCATQYQSEDADAYLCAQCLEQKNKIAKEVDARLSARPKRETKSLIQQYDEAPKMNGFMVVRF